MYTLQGIISRSVDNANQQFQTLGYITTNLANYNTVGYKGQRFENYLVENGRIEGALRVDYATGSMASTKNPYDFAIDGAGFFPVTGKDGKVAYTRDGSFKLDSKGYLVTSDGFMVGDGIKIPPNYVKLKVSEDGTIKAILDNENSEKIVGKIPVVLFNNPEGLKSIEGNKLIATQHSGDPILLKENQKIKHKFLERSNVNMHKSVDEVLRTNASLISSTRLIKVVDEIYRQSVNLRQ